MKTLIKNGKIINVFTGKIEEKNILINDCFIVGVGDYTDEEADVIYDANGKYVCPGFIDGHIHIESTMLEPGELARICVAHGTSAIVADPHEIANVAGTTGISYMIESSENLPMDVYFTIPSCVPATGFDESGAILGPKEIEMFYENDRVLGLAEMMNYPGVICGDPVVHEKIQQAKAHGRVVNGHAPLLSGKDLDKYISAGIQDDHECSSYDEAVERIEKGQWVMIRQGTSARNLNSLIELFETPYNHRCILVTDDKHPYDLIKSGHIDSIIREAVKLGKSAVTGIQMATIQAAQCFNLRNYGAIAPGYYANITVLNDLDTIEVCDVYHNGVCVCKNGQTLPFVTKEMNSRITEPLYNSFKINKLKKEDFEVEPNNGKCRVIKAIPGELLTEEVHYELDFSNNNGVDIERDIIKIAVCERHMNTGHIGLGYLQGLGIKNGAIASSVSHDSHNLIIAGTNNEDMALAGNTIIAQGGGLCVVCNGSVLEVLELPIAGLMSDEPAEVVSKKNQAVRDAVGKLGVEAGIEPFMNTAFISLSVIPNLKINTLGLVDVNKQEIVPLFVKE